MKIGHLTICLGPSPIVQVPGMLFLQEILTLSNFFFVRARHLECSGYGLLRTQGTSLLLKGLAISHFSLPHFVIGSSSSQAIGVFYLLNIDVNDIAANSNA